MDLISDKILYWIKGDNLGKQEVLDFYDETYVYFKSGERIVKLLIDEYLSETKSNFNIQEFTVNHEPENYAHFQQTDTSTISLLFKGKNIALKTIKLNLDLKLPTESALKLILNAYGIDELQLDYLNFIKSQILENLDTLSKKVLDSTTKKVVK